MLAKRLGGTMGRPVASFRHVHVILATCAGLTLLVAAALGWLGWRLLSQEAALLRQQAHDRVEQTADVLLAGLLREMAETESWLSQVGSTLPADSPRQRTGGILVWFSPAGIETQPSGQLLYYPVIPPSPPLDAAVFKDADTLEFRKGDLAATAAALTSLAAGTDAQVRAEALLRLARVQGKSGQAPEALVTYARLAGENRMSPAEAPYGLLSRFARCQLLESSGRLATARQEAAALVMELESGRWPIGRDSFAWYRAAARKLAGASEAQPDYGVKLAVSEAVASLWDEWRLFQRSGSRSLIQRWHRSEPMPVLAVLNANPDRLVALIYAGDSIRRFVLDPGLEGETPVEKQGVLAALLDEKGRPVVAPGGEPTGPQATRTLSAAQLPWQLKVAISSSDSPRGFLAERRIYFILSLAAVVVLVAVACYAMARGVLREAAAGRLQSDFVSAVSHEFRSPLTTLRQLTELLAHGRIQDESRRLLYFDVLQKETSRLHHLVEQLLDFGRMDAGRRQYRFEPLEFSELVRDGIHEYRDELDGNGYQIELTASNGELVVSADREALRRMVRNLLENAVKYSPECRTVWVETAREEQAAVLRVRDRGIGIPPEERPRIFEKFVRGEVAKRACTQGTGIGLAMVQEIVRVHHGEVDVSSEVGRGSTFTVRLPLQHSSKGAAA